MRVVRDELTKQDEKLFLNLVGEKIVRRTRCGFCSEPTNKDSMSGWMQDQRRRDFWLRPGSANCCEVGIRFRTWSVVGETHLNG